MDLSHEFEFHDVVHDEFLRRHCNRRLSALMKILEIEAFPRATLSSLGNGYVVDVRIVTIYDSLRVRMVDLDPYLALNRAFHALWARLQSQRAPEKN